MYLSGPADTAAIQEIDEYRTRWKAGGGIAPTPPAAPAPGGPVRPPDENGQAAGRPDAEVGCPVTPEPVEGQLGFYRIVLGQVHRDHRSHRALPQHILPVRAQRGPQRLGRAADIEQPVAERPQGMQLRLRR